MESIEKTLLENDLVSESSLDSKLKENTKLVAAVLHLKYASDLLTEIDNETSIVLLETANAIISEYQLKQSELDEIKDIEQEISSNE